MIGGILNLLALGLTIYLATKERWMPLLIWLFIMIAVINMIPFFVLPAGDDRLALAGANSLTHVIAAVVGRLWGMWRR